MKTDVNDTLKNNKLNKLSLNIEKTFDLIFRKKKCIHINLVRISEIYFSSFLGLVFINELTWNNHLSMISSKIFKIINLNMLKRFQNIQNKVLFLNAVEVAIGYFTLGHKFKECNIIITK